MSLIDGARQFREEFEASKKATQKLVAYSDLPQDEKDKVISIYDPFRAGETVAVGDIRRYEGALYEVIQAHATQVDWTPDATPALWKAYTPGSTEEGTEIVPDFKQPTGAHDAYKKGDQVLFEGQVYKSLIDANTWSPTDYPGGWELQP